MRPSRSYAAPTFRQACRASRGRVRTGEHDLEHDPAGINGLPMPAPGSPSWPPTGSCRRWSSRHARSPGQLDSLQAFRRSPVTRLPLRVGQRHDHSTPLRNGPVTGGSGPGRSRLSSDGGLGAQRTGSTGRTHDDTSERVSRGDGVACLPRRPVRRRGRPGRPVQAGPHAETLHVSLRGDPARDNGSKSGVESSESPPPTNAGSASREGIRVPGATGRGIDGGGANQVP